VTKDEGTLPLVANGDVAPLMEATGLKMYFPVRGGLLQRKLADVKALDGVDLQLYKGETVGVVGESGCGKSTLGRTLLRLNEPTEGTIRFRGDDITHLNSSGLRPYRSAMQMVFQDPYSSLNPLLTVEELLVEPMNLNHLYGGREKERAAELIERVGLDFEHLGRHPRAFSGGQRQRISIARALAMQPELLILDEPVSALDVSVQAQILNLLLDLREEFNLAFLFITHDLSILRHFADRVAVMYLGKIVEEGLVESVLDHPVHPYTQALLSAIPIDDPADRGKRGRIILEGDVPSPINPPTGCSFHTRCWMAEETCRVGLPPRIAGPEGNIGACHFVGRES
jgi:oligopeptide/dipeptide ABC transporter ATP-binding protein